MMRGDLKQSGCSPDVSQRVGPLGAAPLVSLSFPDWVSDLAQDGRPDRLATAEAPQNSPRNIHRILCDS
jgi:hypothetical protein